MGKNKNGFYNYQVTVYNNRDRTDIKEERLLKERKETMIWHFQKQLMLILHH